MLDFLKPYLLLIALLVLLAINLACFLGGVKLGGRWIQERWDAQKLADAKALSLAQAQSLEKDRRWAAQLQKADDDRDTARADLVRLRAAGVSRILCHTTAGNSGSLSGLPAASSAGAAGNGLIPQATDIDITDALYAEADRADDEVETLRDLWNRWPH